MTKALDYARDYHRRIPFIDLIGLETVALEPGVARLALELRPELLNSFGTAHGGVLMTLLDVAMCQAARTQHPDSQGVMTIDMSTSFMAAGQGRLLAEGRVLKPGRATIFAEGEIRNEDGALVAKSLGTVRVRTKES
jgi:uncharacterized protein (TIGR00369 family)